MRDVLLRGLLAGLLAGLVALGVAEGIGEAQVDRAIAFEAQLYQQAGKPPEPELVSRGVQKTVGLATAALVIGTAFGGLFAFGFAVAHGRIGSLRPRMTALAVAAGGFCAVFLVPFLKYPANPPSIGNPDTIGYRTELYFTMIAFTVTAAVGSVVFGRRLVERYGTWNATLAAAGAFIAAIAAAFVIMPGINEVPVGFPAAVLWRFRIASAGTQLALWATIGLAFGALTERRLASEHRHGVPSGGP